MKHYLAEINIAKLLAPVDDPLIADFVAQLDAVNALAEKSTGFIWRLKDDSNHSAHIQAFDDPLIIVNMSVWECFEDLKNFTYKSHHADVFAQRSKWFVRMQEAQLALWWIEEGRYPDVQEGKARLEHLQQHGDSDYSFSPRWVMNAKNR